MTTNTIRNFLRLILSFCSFPYFSSLYSKRSESWFTLFDIPSFHSKWISQCLMIGLFFSIATLHKVTVPPSSIRLIPLPLRSLYFNTSVHFGSSLKYNTCKRSILKTFFRFIMLFTFRCFNIDSAVFSCFLLPAYNFLPGLPASVYHKPHLPHNNKIPLHFCLRKSPQTDAPDHLPATHM